MEKIIPIGWKNIHSHQICLEDIRKVIKENEEFDDCILSPLKNNPILEACLTQNFLYKKILFFLKKHTSKSDNFVFITIENFNNGVDKSILEKFSSKGISNIKIQRAKDFLLKRRGF